MMNMMVRADKILEKIIIKIIGADKMEQTIKNRVTYKIPNVFLHNGVG